MAYVINRQRYSDNFCPNNVKRPYLLLTISTKKKEPPQKMDKTTSISHSLVAIEVSMFDVIKKSSY